MEIPQIAFNLFLTVIAYVLPILILRFAIVKHPFEPKKAKIISICYGIFMFCLFVIVPGIIYTYNNTYTPLEKNYSAFPALFWSFINYEILTKRTNGGIISFAKNQKYFFSIFSETVKITNAKASYIKSKEKDKHSKYLYIDIYIEGETSSGYYKKNIGFNINVLDCNNDPIAGSAWKDNKNYTSIINKDGSFKISTTLTLEEMLKNSICYVEFKNPIIQLQTQIK